MTRSLVSISAAAVSLLGASALGAAALAQTAGTYNGTQANGQSISITVGTDSSNNSTALTGFGFSASAPCHGGETNNSGYGFGFTQDITGTKATILFNYQFIYVDATLSFDNANNTVKGYITTYSPVLITPQTGHPTKTALCTGARQSFTATLGADVAESMKKQPKVVIY